MAVVEGGATGMSAGSMADMRPCCERVLCRSQRGGGERREGKRATEGAARDRGRGACGSGAADRRVRPHAPSGRAQLARTDVTRRARDRRGPGGGNAVRRSRRTRLSAQRSGYETCAVRRRRTPDRSCLPCSSIAMSSRSASTEETTRAAARRPTAQARSWLFADPPASQSRSLV